MSEAKGCVRGRERGTAHAVRPAALPYACIPSLSGWGIDNAQEVKLTCMLCDIGLVQGPEDFQGTTIR